MIVAMFFDHGLPTGVVIGVALIVALLAATKRQK
jgi:hypothetical protein